MPTSMICFIKCTSDHYILTILKPLFLGVSHIFFVVAYFLFRLWTSCFKTTRGSASSSWTVTGRSTAPCKEGRSFWLVKRKWLRCWDAIWLVKTSDYAFGMRFDWPRGANVRMGCDLIGQAERLRCWDAIWLVNGSVFLCGVRLVWWNGVIELSGCVLIGQAERFTVRWRLRFASWVCYAPDASFVRVATETEKGRKKQKSKKSKSKIKRRKQGWGGGGRKTNVVS